MHLLFSYHVIASPLLISCLTLVQMSLSSSIVSILFLLFCLTKGWVLLVYMGPAFYHPELHNSHSQSSQWLPKSLELWTPSVLLFPAILSCIPRTGLGFDSAFKMSYPIDLFSVHTCQQRHQPNSQEGSLRIDIQLFRCSDQTAHPPTQVDQ